MSNSDSAGTFLSGQSMSRRRLLSRAALVGVGAVAGGPLLAACNRGSASAGAASGGKKVGFSFLYSEVPAAAAIKRFAKERASQTGFDLLTDNVTGGKVDQQLASLDSYFTRHVSALVVHAVEPTAYSGAVKRAHDQKTVIVSYATSIPGADAALLFPPDDAATATSNDAANYINQNLGGQGNVLILSFTTGELNKRASDNLAKGITSSTKATVVATQDALDQATGLRVTEDVLKAHPDVNIVLAWNDAGALGAAQAFKNVGKDPAKCFIASNEGSQLGLQSLGTNPYLKAVSALSMRDLGYGIVDLPKTILGGGAKKDLLVGRHLVHPGDAEIKNLLAEYS